MICKLKKHIKRIIFFCLSLTLTGITYSSRAYATDIDVDRRCEFQIEMFEDGVPLRGMTFNIYHVADMNPDGTYGKVDPRFADYKIDPNFKNQNEWLRFASTLEMSIIRDGISSDAKRVTDEDGMISIDNLSTGLYMVSGLDYRHDNHLHEVNPFMVTLPTKIDGNWQYDILSHPKYPGEVEVPKKVSYNVVFLWDDEGKEDQRPDSVEIALVKMNNSGVSNYSRRKSTRSLVNQCYAFEENDVNEYGVVVDTATIYADTGWKHTWKNIDYGWEYDIVTDELQDYYITAAYDKHTFIFRHRNIECISEGEFEDPFAKPNDDSSSNGNNEDEHTSGGVVDSNANGESDKNMGSDIEKIDQNKNSSASKDNTSSNNGRKDKLPQTGQLWWPVPLMILVGLILCMIGIVRRRGDENEK